MSFAVQQPKECDGTKPKLTMKEDLEADIAKHTGAAAWQRQPHNIKQQPTEQTAQERKEKKKKKRGQVEKEKGQGERERGERGKREEETGEKGKEVQEETDNEVEKHVTGWTEVSRKRKKMVQIFVKVDGGKTSVMEMEMNDKVDDVVKKIPISDQDVYVTSGGRILKGSDKLKSCEVRDGSTVEVTSRMRSGGKHKDKKSKAEKKQVMSQKAVSSEGPAILESEKEAIIRMWEENEGNRTFVQGISEGSDVEMEQTLQIYRAAGREALRWNQGQADIVECGLRWAVEARRKARRQHEEEQRRQGEQGQHLGQEESKREKQVNLDDEEQARAKNTDEPEVMGRLTEVRTGRGSAGLVRGGDERCWADETNRKGKGKGNGGKGEHEGKGGGFGHKGKQQEKREREEEQVRMAPNMLAGGSHPQAMSDLGETEMAEGEQERNEEKEEILKLLRGWQEKETSPIVRWALADESAEEEINQEEVREGSGEEKKPEG